MKFTPCNWLVLVILEDESNTDVKRELDECGLYISPDRWDLKEGLLKWNISGYSENQIKLFIEKIEKQLTDIGGLKYEFYCE